MPCALPITHAARTELFHVKPNDKNKHDQPAPVNTVEVLFTCAFIPVLLRGNDPKTNEDNIRIAIRLGKLAAKMMAEAR